VAPHRLALDQETGALALVHCIDNIVTEQASLGRRASAFLCSSSHCGCAQTYVAQPTFIPAEQGWAAEQQTVGATVLIGASQLLP
jgi:hypothetical protein